MLEGKIIKGVGGFYYVETADCEIYTCRARGVFRNIEKTPLVGDNVKIRISDEKDMEGYVEEILERKNQLLRPPIANIDQIVIIFALKNPKPNLWLLDKFLIQAEAQELDITVCLNKSDLVKEEKAQETAEIYRKAGYRVILSSVEEKRGIDELKEIMKDRTTAVAGPSGVGKSTLLNEIQPGLELETGDVSRKTARGRHTTRHSELHELDFGGFVFDTPGFSSLELDFLDEDSLEDYFIEIGERSESCRFRGCRHNKEPGCAVKEAVEAGEISKERYENYLMFLKDIMERNVY